MNSRFSFDETSNMKNSPRSPNKQFPILSQLTYNNIDNSMIVPNSPRKKNMMAHEANIVQSNISPISPKKQPPFLYQFTNPQIEYSSMINIQHSPRRQPKASINPYLENSNCSPNSPRRLARQSTIPIVENSSINNTPHSPRRQPKNSIDPNLQNSSYYPNSSRRLTRQSTTQMTENINVTTLPQSPLRQPVNARKESSFKKISSDYLLPNNTPTSPKKMPKQIFSSYMSNNNSAENRYKFFWNSGLDPLKKDNENWTAYQPEIQEYLNNKYVEFLNGNKEVINIIYPLHSYMIDFESGVQYLSTCKDLKRKIRIEDLNAPIINSYSQLEEEFLFSWKSDPLNPQETERWILYPRDIQQLLNNKFKDFLQGNLEPVNLIYPLNGYLIDFGRKIQYLDFDPGYQKPIKIEGVKGPNFIKQDFVNNIQLVDETQNISRINYEKNEIINQQKEILYGPETNIATQPYNTQDYSRIVNNSINASLLKSPKKSMISLSPMRTFSKSPKKAPISPIKSPRKSSKGYRNLDHLEPLNPPEPIETPKDEKLLFYKNKKIQIILLLAMIPLMLAYIYRKNSNMRKKDFDFEEENLEEIEFFKMINKTEIEFKDSCLDIPKIQISKKKPLNIQRRFILGKCNPVLIVPGFLDMRIVASLDCPKILEEPEKLYELRHFCGNIICKSSLLGKYNIEEYNLWPVILDNPFKHFEDSENSKNTCWAYLMRHFNSKTDCPDNPLLKKSLCLYNRNIQVSYFGDTSDTMKKSECGTKTVVHTVDPVDVVDKGTSTNSSKVKFGSFIEFIDSFKKKGYTLGYSLASLPYDWRKFYGADEIFKEKFENLVEMLYRNTGKKVIIVAHSFGNLNVLKILNKNNHINSKIKRYVGLAPPYSGVPKTIETFSYSLRDSRNKAAFMQDIDLGWEALKFSGVNTPVSYLFNLKPYLHQISKVGKYKEFINALEERFELEKNCGILSQNYNQICKAKYIEDHSHKFKSIFPFFPQFDSDSCQVLRKKILHEFHNQEFLELYKQKRADISKLLPSYEGCELRIFDYLRCPYIKILNQDTINKNFTLANFHNQCYESDDEVIDNSLIFSHHCLYTSNSKNCILDFLKNYTTFEVKSFYEKKGPEYYQMPENFQMNMDEYKIALDLLNEKMNDSETLGDYDPPKVPTSIVYTSSFDTVSNFIFNFNNKSQIFDIDNVGFYGGDGIVPSYSSLITPMRWIYDNQKSEIKSQIQIVNYCSYLSNYPEFYYDFSNKTKGKEFVALECECMTTKGFDIAKIIENRKTCSHSSIALDKNVINYVFSMASDEPVYNKFEDYSKSIYRAFSNSVSLNFEEICNKILHDYD